RRAARGRRRAGLVLAILGGAAAAGLVFFLRPRASTPAPLFQQLTFRRGTLWNARFSTDGRTIVSAAAWGGEPFALYSMRLPATSARRLGSPGTDLLAISDSGELAVSLGSRPVLEGVTRGTLARLPLEGGAPREVLQDVLFADWDPRGGALAVVRSDGGEFR